AQRMRINVGSIERKIREIEMEMKQMVETLVTQENGENPDEVVQGLPSFREMKTRELAQQRERLIEARAIADAAEAEANASEANLHKSIHWFDNHMMQFENYVNENELERLVRIHTVCIEPSYYATQADFCNQFCKEIK